VRKRNTQTENDDEIVEGKNELEQALEEFDELVENGGVTVNGRIYRCLPPNEKGFAQPTELCGKVDHKVDEDFVGRTFGSGKYKVRYIIKDADGNKAEKNFIYSIGKEYDAFVKPSEPSRAPEVAQTQPARGGFLEKILNELTPEKVTVCTLALEGLKKIFAPPPPPPQPDWAALLQILTATNKDAKPALSDTIVLAAMDSMKEKQKQPSFLEQYREMKELERELKDGSSTEGEGDENDEEENGETMNALLKMAMALLPQMLQKNNNNFQATGAEAAENAYVKNLVASDPQLALTFFEKAKQKYGLENAQKLALGFGYNLQDAPQEKGAEGAENG
jgi:hypothetical protein